VGPTLKYHLTVRVDVLNHRVASGNTFARSAAGRQIFLSVTSCANGYAECFAATVLYGAMFAYANTGLTPPEKKLRS
jgi:hypothetical protein